MFGGNFRKFGTESKGISGTFCALALLCAKAGPVLMSAATRAHAAMRRFMTTSETVVDAIYTSPPSHSSATSSVPKPEGPTFAPDIDDAARAQALVGSS